MNITTLLAQFWGILFVVLGLSVILNKKSMSAVLQEMTQNKGYLWLMGFVMLALGAILVVLSNVWTSGLTLLITVIGWLVLIKGIFILFFPDDAVSLYRKFNTNRWLVLMGVVALVLGLILMYRVM